MWCPSCIYFYDDVKQMTLPFRVQHTTEFLADRSRAPVHPSGCTDAWRSTRTSERAAAARGAAARRLLAAVPGLTVLDVEPTLAFDRSCTAAVQEKLGPAAWDALVLDEIDRARAGGADTLATIYHGCQRLICGFERRRPITIEHYLSVFARGLGIEYEDKYKRTCSRECGRDPRRHDAVPADQRCRPREGPRTGDGDVCPPLRPRRGRHAS